MPKSERTGKESQGETVDLSPHEEREAKRRAGMRAAVVFESVRREGESELRRAPIALAFSGLAAGLSMGLSLVGTGLLRAALPPAPWRPIVESAGYTLGFLVTILARQQLFTENTVTAILPLLDDSNKLQKGTIVARLWAIVLASNFIGTLVFAFAIAHSGAFSGAASRAFLELGQQTLSYDFATVLVKGIFAGWMIALLVWLLPVAEGSRIGAIAIVTYAVGLGALSHVVAGSAEGLYAVAVGAASWPQFALHFFVPAFLGNSIGGVFLVSLLNYAQVAVKNRDEQT